ncbi:hypothetical protein I4641_21515 [Waterburya agarophytonicola K14]|uniref:Uncharacterized protein n=1 Tax=Waterburya agarophytonicola KI4 TaxID=2874699 RepID=A0A964BW96_9CYAN|nr:hypothetical protein [Waterburya agarophytonicola]MCC0179542.1 hypothetical protein [Waterburya agarophytonicola KI4]
MTKHQGMKSLAAPCIVDEGILINHDDIRRLLTDMCHVHYVHTIDGQIKSKGNGFIQEIFSDYHQSTLIANKKIYININSFDYLQLSKSTENETCFNLIQDSMQLCLIPIPRKIEPQAISKNIDAEAIEAMVTEVLSARLDVQLDDEDFQ